MTFSLKADYSKYESNSYFYGSIVSAYSKSKHLVYCVDAVNIKNFLKIDDYKSYERMYERPDPGSIFIYLSSSRKSYYRALCLGKTPVGSCVMKVFFVDTGEIHYLTYDKNKFFHFPDQFCNIPVMRIFCEIVKYPKSKFKSVIEFIDECSLNKIKFKIRGKKFIENEAKKSIECVIVDAQDVYLNNTTDYVEASDSILTETEDEKGEALKLTKSTLMKFNYKQAPAKRLSYTNEPFMSSKIPIATNTFQLSQKILIYPGIFLKSNQLYGNCKSIHKAHSDTSTLTSLMINMNKFNTIYEKLDRIPVLNEMVIIRDQIKDLYRNFRGQVLEIFDDTCLVLYVDYGQTRPISCKKLFKFPIEFSNVPFHTSRVHITNIQIAYDDIQNHKNMIIVQQHIKPFGIGIVEEVAGFDIFVKLYDNKGININNVLSMINKPLKVPRFKNKRI